VLDLWIFWTWHDAARRTRVAIRSRRLTARGADGVWTLRV